MDTRDLLLEFLEVSFHVLLYCRDIYPREVFERRKMYNIEVSQSVHADINAYIRDVCNGVRDLMANDDCGSVSFVIMDERSRQVLEKFIFEFRMLESIVMDFSSAHVRFREVIKRFYGLPPRKQHDSSENASFQIFISAKEGIIPHSAISDLWTPVEKDEEPRLSNPAVLPLKSAGQHSFRFQVYLETPYPREEEAGKKDHTQ